MKFTVSTKPIATAVDLAVVNNNVTDFHKLSQLAQIRVKGRELTINVVSDRITTEIILKGAPEHEDDESMVFVSCLTLKQLLLSFDSNSIVLEFEGDGPVADSLTIYSGSSHFKLPKLTDADMLLDAPNVNDYDFTKGVDINKSDWKFVKDNQMYALAMSFAYPVYTRVWVGENGNVIVGDMNKGLFTLAKKSNFGKTCLFNMTFINLFNVLPDGTQIIAGENNYLLHAKSDGFEYVTEFSPEYEDDGSVGSYNSDIICESMTHPDNSISVNPATIKKYLNQAILLAAKGDTPINVVISEGQLQLQDDNVDCKVPAPGYHTDKTISERFCLPDLRDVMNRYSGEFVSIGAVLGDEDTEVSGLVFFDDELTTLLSAVEG